MRYSQLPGCLILFWLWVVLNILHKNFNFLWRWFHTDFSNRKGRLLIRGAIPDNSPERSLGTLRVETEQSVNVWRSNRLWITAQRVYTSDAFSIPYNLVSALSKKNVRFEQQARFHATDGSWWHETRPQSWEGCFGLCHVYRLNDGRRKSYLFTPMKCDGCKISLTLEL